MLEDRTVTKYAVARRTTLVSDGYDTVAEAQQQNAHISDTMTAIGLKPDVHVVEVEVTTTVGRPRAYVEPKDDEVEEPTSVDDEQPGDDENAPADPNASAD